jgi:hypothetical protein
VVLLLLVPLLVPVTTALLNLVVHAMVRHPVGFGANEHW